jgi:hypothetical protein
MNRMPNRRFFQARAQAFVAAALVTLATFSAIDRLAAAESTPQLSRAVPAATAHVG